MIKYVVICDKCGKEAEEYIRVLPEPCLKDKNPMIVIALSKPKEFCIDCWKEIINPH